MKVLETEELAKFDGKTSMEGIILCTAACRWGCEEYTAAKARGNPKSATKDCEEGLTTKTMTEVRTVDTGEGTVSVAPEIQEGPKPVGYSSILIATDGSACSALAGRHAIYLAEGLGADLLILYAVDVARAFHTGVHYGEAMAELERFGQEATARIREMAEKRGVRCKERVVSGRPHDAIIAASEQIGADLVVVGSTGMTSVERVLIGSESEKVLRYCKRPVLLVRDDA